MQINEFVKKLQSLPEQKKKIILWTSIAILTLLLFSWYFKDAREILRATKIEKIWEEELKIPKIQEKTGGTFQQIELKEEETRKIEEIFSDLIREAEEQMEKEQMEKQKEKSK